MIRNVTAEDKAEAVTTYFCDKYGEDRALVIIQKIAPSIRTMDIAGMIKVGEKWHYFNLLMNDKITLEECRKALHDLGYE